MRYLILFPETSQSRQIAVEGFSGHIKGPFLKYGKRVDEKIFSTWFAEFTCQAVEFANPEDFNQVAALIFASPSDNRMSGGHGNRHAKSPLPKIVPDKAEDVAGNAAKLITFIREAGKSVTINDAARLLNVPKDHIINAIKETPFEYVNGGWIRPKAPPTSKTDEQAQKETAVQKPAPEATQDVSDVLASKATEDKLAVVKPSETKMQSDEKPTNPDGGTANDPDKGAGQS